MTKTRLISLLLAVITLLSTVSIAFSALADEVEEIDPNGEYTEFVEANTKQVQPIYIVEDMEYSNMEFLMTDGDAIIITMRNPETEETKEKKQCINKKM